MIQEFISNNLQWLIPMMVATVIIVILFLPKFKIVRILDSSEKLMEYLTYKLREAKYRVEERPKHLMIRISRWSAVEIFKLKKTNESEIAYRASATPAGWGIIIILIMMTTVNPLIGIVSILVIICIYLRDRQFVYQHITPILKVDGIISNLIPNNKDEINIKLVTGLSEGFRLASEAYEAERGSRQNYQAIVVIGIIIIWATFFPFIVIDKENLTVQLWNVIQLALLLTIAFSIFLLWFIHRWFHLRINQYQQWSKRLQERLSQEVAGKVPQNEPSTFETLAETSQEIPVWIKSIQRKGLNLDPGSELLINLSLGTFFLVFISFFIVILLGNLFAAMLLGAVLAIVSLGSYMYYKRWKQRWIKTTKQTLNNWKKNYDELYLKMEKYLQDM